MLFCHNQTVSQFNLQEYSYNGQKIILKNLFTDKHFNVSVINKEYECRNIKVGDFIYKCRYL